MSALLAGCSHTTRNPQLPVGDAAHTIFPAETAPRTTYRVRPLDVLNVKVLNEPQLSSEELMVSEVGDIQMLLIGSVPVAGLSPQDISREIEQRLGKDYLVDPQVSVSVQTLAPRYASVEGEVEKPGVYEINTDATLLSTIARAESPTSTAKLDEIVIFRTIEGQRMVARFNLKDIRTGISPDPRILDGDVVMVGFSATRGLVEDILEAAPLFNAWARF
ncbi:polysaccharide biosynthesis/export family protein [Novosphingobium sp. BW1]|uniref:polysaccharide biosynthesis/export family protein n=1 Tax=Novosphingobium sp. BW1 TaxID=2592621 RepID=UPI002110CAB0|nr:polysaccharide biosynthesis/export family protein [Novosphingobium sp. BW1]